MQLVLKGIEWLDQLSTKRNGNLQVSLARKKGPHTLRSMKHKSLQKRTWQLLHYF